MESAKFSLAIHGGAGALKESQYSKSDLRDHFLVLEQALKKGLDLLKAGGSSLEACIQAVVVLEDCELYNAGKGSVIGSDHKVTMDASIMCGKTQDAGAIGGLAATKNPILAANKVLTESPHPYLCGKEADQFALDHGLEHRDQSYFKTPYRQIQLEKALKRGIITLDHTPDEEGGTVGAVAMDQSGNLAAATSTGGMTGKRPGRISDSSVIGAGTFAKNGYCAISGTGQGDFFIRKSFAHEVVMRMEFAGESLDQACQNSLAEMAKLGGLGGAIAVDAFGKVALPYNTHGMWRGWCSESVPAQIGVFGTMDETHQVLGGL